MPHIALPDLPGIRALMTYRPETSKPLNDLAEVLLRGPRALAAHQLEGGEDLVEKTKQDVEQAGVSDKMKALLAVAGKVQQGGKSVASDDVQRASEQGATDLEIHDTVLAAAFCMFNRYVDGLATFAPQDPDFYRARGAYVAEKGYVAVGQEYAVRCG